MANRGRLPHLRLQAHRNRRTPALPAHGLLQQEQPRLHHLRHHQHHGTAWRCGNTRCHDGHAGHSRHHSHHRDDCLFRLANCDCRNHRLCDFPIHQHAHAHERPRRFSRKSGIRQQGGRKGSRIHPGNRRSQGLQHDRQTLQGTERSHRQVHSSKHQHGTQVRPAFELADFCRQAHGRCHHDVLDSFLLERLHGTCLLRRHASVLLYALCGPGAGR